MRKASLQQRAVELIEQLSAEKLKTVIDYLSYLQDEEAWKRPTNWRATRKSLKV